MEMTTKVFPIIARIPPRRPALSGSGRQPVWIALACLAAPLNAWLGPVELARKRPDGERTANGIAPNRRRRWRRETGIAKLGERGAAALQSREFPAPIGPTELVLAATSGAVQSGSIRANLERVYVATVRV